jgi:hypothetical protein
VTGAEADATSGTTAPQTTVPQTTVSVPPPQTTVTAPQVGGTEAPAIGEADAERAVVHAGRHGGRGTHHPR